MKKILLASSLLLAPVLIATEEVQAQENRPGHESPETTYHSAVQSAKDEGVILVQEQPMTFSRIGEANQAYYQQTKELQEATQQYALEKDQYARDLASYEAALKEINQYQEAEAKRKKEEAAAQAQYQQELATYEKDQVQYQTDLKNYQQQEELNKQLKENYQTELAKFEKELADYQVKEESYQKEKAEQDQVQKSFQEKQTQYEKERSLYQEAEKAHQAALTKAQADSQKDGFLSQVYAQYLIAKSEPNASVRFEGVSSFIASSHDFGSGLDGVAGTIDKLPLTSQATLFKGVGSGTPAGSGDGYGLILEKNQPIRVSYTNLTNTSYKGQKITRLDYTYELLSTFAEDGKATAFIYTDPTKTIYVGTHGNNQGQVDFAIRQTMTYFFEDGSPVIFDKDKTALLSFASRNNSFEFGEQEFVQLDASLSFIPITGSSVSGENGYVAARGSNNSKADGSKLDRSEWDQDSHSNEYYGAGVALATGGEISFTFGIRYNPNDIQKSANPSRLRDRSRQWFTVNADIKASGLIQREKPGNPPIAPLKPDLLNKKLEAPKKPLQPKELAYATVSQPVQPKKPELKVIPDLPPLTVTAIKPTAPKAPVVFLHQIRYKKPLPSISVTQPTRPTKKPLSPKPVRPVTNTRPVVSYPAHTRVYPAPTFNYNQYQGIRYRQPYVPSASVTYPSYASGWANQAAPTSRVTSPATNPEQKAPKPGENKPKPKGENKGQEKNWFSSNTGFNDKETKAVLDYIRKTGAEAKKSHPNDRAAYNRDVAQSLAYGAYKTDDLQKLFNIYLSQPLVEDGSVLQAISNTHKNYEDKKDEDKKYYPLDLPHMLTTLASLEKQNGRFDYTAFIKRLAVQPLINPLANPVTFI